MKDTIYRDDAIKCCRNEWEEEVEERLRLLPSAQPYTDAEIQKMQDVEQAQFKKVYQLGYEEGKKDAQPERKKGEWINKPDIYLDEQTWEYSECGEPWIFIEGTPSENNANFCPNCGADMRSSDSCEIHSKKTLESQRWISCSERLPDYHEEVLVTSRGEVAIAWLYLDDDWRSNDMPESMYKDIVAWMPLPEPYIEEGEK